MAKPGVKETNKNEYKADLNGVLIIKNNEFFIDVAKDDKPEKLINVKKYFNKLNGEFVNFSLKKVIVEEIEVSED